MDEEKYEGNEVDPSEFNTYDEEDETKESEQNNENEDMQNKAEKTQSDSTLSSSAVQQAKAVTKEKNTPPNVKKTGVMNDSFQKGEEFHKTGEEERVGRKSMARMIGNMEMGERVNDELLVTIEKLRQVVENGVNLIAKMDNARSEMRKTNESAVQVNQQLESCLSQVKDFFQNDYQSLLNDSNRRQMSSYLTQSRDGYMTLFHLAVKNFKQFSESAIKWQKKMETESGKELKQIYSLTKYMPYLLITVILLQIATIGYVYVMVNNLR